MAISVVAGLTAVGSAMITAGTFAITWGKALTAFALGAGLSAVSRALAPKPDAVQLSGVTDNVRNPISSKKIIYGKTRVGGTFIMIGTDGNDNKYLTLAMAVAGHRVHLMQDVYLNEDRILQYVIPAGQNQNPAPIYNYDPKYRNTVTFEFIDGSSEGSTSDLAMDHIANVNTTHTFKDTATLVTRLTYDAEIYTQGIPKITCIVEGKRVYDPRQDETSSYHDSNIGSGHRLNGTFDQLGFTSNSALVLLDYLLDEKYGLGESIDNIDLQSFVDAANVCDEDVALDDGGTQKRYTCDGVLDTSRSIASNIEDILSTMIGTLTLVGGKYVCNAYEYRSPSLDIDESVMIAPLVVTTKQSRRNLYNAVKGTFISADQNYTATDYTAQVSDIYAIDDGGTSYLDMTLPLTTDSIRAQRIARLTMLKSRLQTTVQMTLNLTGLKVKVGDNIRLTNERLGYENKIFEVTSFNLVPDQSQGLSVVIEAIENDSAAYVWNTSDELDFTTGGEVELYDGKTAEPVTNLSLEAFSDLNDDGSITPAIGVSWTDPDDAFTDRYEITWQNTTDSGEVYKQTTLGSPFVVSPVAASRNYEINVYAINERGVKSVAKTASVDTTSDYQPKVPSLYRISKNESTAPSDSEFQAKAGRPPKDNDVVIITDTSISPNPTHVWTYNAITDEWVLDDNFISGDVIIDGSVVAANIANAAIGSDQIASDAITNAKIAIDAIQANVIAAGAIERTAIADNAVDTAKIAIDAIQGDVIAAGAITETKIEDDAISTNKLSANAVVASKIAAGAITANEIATGTITAAEMLAGTITANEIASNTITAAEILANTITGSEIASDTITANLINVGQLSALSADMGTITAGTISSGTVKANTIELNGTTMTADANGLKLNVFDAYEHVNADTVGLIGGVSGENSTDNSQTIYVNELVTGIYGSNNKPAHIAGSSSTLGDPNVTAGDVAGGTPRFQFNFTTKPFSGTRDFIIQAGISYLGTSSFDTESFFAIAMRATTSSTAYSSQNTSDYVITDGTYAYGDAALGLKMVSDKVSLQGDTEYYIWAFGLGDDGIVSYQSGYINVFGLNK